MDKVKFVGSNDINDGIEYSVSKYQINMKKVMEEFIYLEAKTELHKEIDNKFNDLSFKINQQWEEFAQKYLINLNAFPSVVNFDLAIEYRGTLEGIRIIILKYLPGVKDAKSILPNAIELIIPKEIRKSKILQLTFLMNLNQFWYYTKPLGIAVRASFIETGEEDKVWLVFQ